MVTVTSTVPAPAGDVAVSDEAEFTVKLAAFVEPNLTALTFLKKEPVMVTDVPPVPGPLLGVTLVTVGSLAAYAGTTPPVTAYAASTARQAATSERAALPVGQRAIRSSRVRPIPACERPVGWNMFRLL
jgi:NAD(P)-dependent dehydrogenase (short-subunit alcohol dehydrogenase family)